MKISVVTWGVVALLIMPSWLQAACLSKGDRGIELRQEKSAEGVATYWEADRIERHYSPVSNRETLIVDIKADGDVFFSSPAQIECGANRRFFTNGLNSEPVIRPLAPKGLLQQVEKRFCLQGKQTRFSSLGGLVLAVGKENREQRTKRAIWHINHETGKRIYSFELEKGEVGKIEQIEGVCGQNDAKQSEMAKNAALLFCPCLMPLRL